MARPTNAQLEKELRAKTKELDDFRDKVKKVTMNHPSGCSSGKREFLADIGLDAESELEGTYILTLSLELTTDDLDSLEDNNGQTFASRAELCSYIKGNWDASLDNGNYYVELETVEFEE